MAAQQGTGQTVWQSHYDVFHPGMIASQYPHSIKSALFRESAPGAILRFGTACGRHGGDTQRPQSADNFDGSAPAGGVRYAAGGGAYVTDTISYETLPAGLLSANIAANAGAISVKTGTGEFAVNPGTLQANINEGELLRINNSEIVKVHQVGAVSSGVLSLSVLRGVFGTTATTASENDKVEIYGRSNTFAGVALKDITIDGRWIESETDSFVDLDEVPVGIKGDYAVLLDFDGAGDATSGAVKGGVAPDRPVSVRLNNTGTKRVGNVYRPYPTRNYGYFASDNFQDANTIIVKGARYVTGPYEATLHTRGTRGPGSGAAEKVVVASVRFGENV